jgi:hypothetical protein
MSITEKEEVELLYALKQLPDFESFPLPDSWYEKYKLAKPKVINPRQFIESNYAMEMALAPKDLPPIIIDEPQQGGKLVAVPDEPMPHVEVRSRPFDWDITKPFPAVLTQADDPVFQAIASQHHTSSSVSSADPQSHQGDLETEQPAHKSSSPSSAE